MTCENWSYLKGIKGPGFQHIVGEIILNSSNNLQQGYTGTMVKTVWEERERMVNISTTRTYFTIKFLMI